MRAAFLPIVTLTGLAVAPPALAGPPAPAPPAPAPPGSALPAAPPAPAPPAAPPGSAPPAAPPAPAPPAGALPAAPPAGALPAAPPSGAPVPWGAPYPAPYPLPPPGAYPYPYMQPYPYGVPPPGWPKPGETRWYGWQMLIPGIISHVATGVGAMFLGLPALIPGLTGSVFSAPIVHWAHGHVGRGFASFGIHAGTSGLATGLWFVGFAGRGGGAFYGLTALGLSFMATGLALDAALLAKDPVEYGAPRAGRTPAISLVPLVVPRVDYRSDRREAPPVGAALAVMF